ncbi:MAG: hypothetical protein EA359_13540 [Balneolaceae bacterium]|nr:MAG: hypothetical protein EA359_13540 [Balneolaceae bacterium]
MNKIILLGFCGSSIPVIADLANEIYQCKNFDVVKNIEVGKTDFPWNSSDYRFKVSLSGDYKFNHNDIPNIHFGVLHSHIKFILFHYFEKHHCITEERYLNLIYQNSYFAKSSSYSHGFMLQPMSAVSSFCEIGFGVTIKRGSSIGHHVKLGNFVNLNPGVVLSGHIEVGDGTEIGTGTCVGNNITIGKNCLIGTGSVVTKNIPDGVVAYGNPCKVIRENERWNLR